MPTATGGSTIGVKRSVSARRRPGMRPLPQKRNPSTMPSTVAPPTVSTMNDSVRPSSPQTSDDFQMSMKFSKPTYCGGPGGGHLVAIETDAEQPEQRHDVPDDERRRGSGRAGCVGKNRLSSSARAIGSRRRALLVRGGSRWRFDWDRWSGPWLVSRRDVSRGS